VPVVVLAVVLALVATACGGREKAGGGGGTKGGGSAEGATTTIESGPAGQVPSGTPGPPCRLVTDADVGSAVGSSVRQAGSNDRSCVFALTSAADQIVLVTTSPGSVSAFEAGKAGGPVENIPGLGDRAFVSGGKAMVLKGNTLLLVIVGLKQPNSTLSGIARKLAQAATARI
jgi:hypothetical protein